MRKRDEEPKGYKAFRRKVEVSSEYVPMYICREGWGWNFYRDGRIDYSPYQTYTEKHHNYDRTPVLRFLLIAGALPHDT